MARNQTVIQDASGNASVTSNFTAASIGIGTTTPSAPLAFAKAVYGGASTEDFYRIKFQDNGGIHNDVGIGQPVSGSLGINYGAAGYIAFSEGTNLERMRIDAGGNVGIGTTAPVAKLNVAGSLQVGDSATNSISLRLTRTNSTFVADAHYFTAVANTPVQSWIEGGYLTGERTGTITAPNSGYPYYEEWIGNGSATAKGFGFINKTSGTFTGTDVLIAMYLKRTGQMQLAKYGIGTFTGTVAYNLAVDALGNIIETAGGVVDGSGTAGYVSKWSDPNTLTNSVLYDSGTHIGIGTASPLAYFDGALAARALQIVGSGRTGINLQDNTGTNQYLNIGVNGANAFIEAVYSTTPTINYNAYSTHVFITGSTPTEKMRITAAGNVGVGTNNPTQKLHVEGTFKAYQDAASYILLDGSSLTMVANNAITIGDNNTDSVTIGAATGENRPTLIKGGPISLMTSGLTRVTVAQNGNVGIGDTGPSSKVQIAGDIRISGSGSAIDGYDGGFLDYASSTLRIRGQNSTGGAIAFLTTANGASNVATERMRITATGNVGIGTTNPSNKIHIALSDAAHTNQGIYLDSAGGWGGAALYHDYVNSGGVYTNFKISNTYSDTRIDLVQDSYNPAGNPGSMRFITQPTGNGNVGVERMRITSTGSIGIGKTNPAYLLDINGSFSTTTSGVELTYNSGIIYHGPTYYQFPSGGYYLLYGRAGMGLIFGSNNAEVGRFDLSGNLGVGTTTPSYKLHVNGFVNATGYVNSGTTFNKSIYIGNITAGTTFALGRLNFADVYTHHFRVRISSYYGVKTFDFFGYQATMYKTVNGISNGGDVVVEAVLDGSNQYTGVKIGITTVPTDYVYTATIECLSRFSSWEDYASNTVLTPTTIGFLNTFMNLGGGNLSINSNVYNVKFSVNSGISSSTANVISIQQNTNGAVKDAAALGIAVHNNGEATNAASLLFTTAINGALTEKMRLTHDGLLGIGTTAPTEKLVVQGNGAKMRIETGTAPTVYYTQIESNYDASNTFNIIDGGQNKFGSRALVTYNDTYINSFYNVYIATGTVGNTSANNIRLFVTQTGNVGIGTTSPEAQLQVGAELGTGLNVYSFSGYKFGVENGSSRFIGPEVTASNQTVVIADFMVGASAAWNSPTGILTFSSRDRGNNVNGGVLGYIGIAKSTSVNSVGSGNLIFGTAAADSATSTERMRITTTGNVGIGTTSPQTALDVVGSIRVSGTGGSGFFTGASAIFESAVAWSGVASTAFKISNVTSVGLVFGASNSQLMTLTSTGNLGIGTNTPQTGVKLDVVGAAAIAGGSEGLRIGNVGDNSAYDNVKLYYTGYNSAVPRVYLTPRTTPGSGIVNTYFHLQNSNGSSTTSNNVMGLLVDGSVGIGTTAPTRKLDVFNPLAPQIRISDGTAGSFWEFYSTFFSTQQDLFIQNQNGVAITINASRRVAIGTTANINQLLTVQGTIAASGTVGYTLNGTTNGNQVLTGESAPRGIAGLTAVGTSESFAIKTDPLGRAFGTVGLVGAAYDASGGGRNVLGVYGYALQNPATANNAENKPIAGLFISELGSNAGASAVFNGTMYGVYASSNSSAATNSAGTIIGVYGVATGRTNDTTYGGYFSAGSGSNNYAAVFMGGNVGIGTTAPAAKLDVVGDANITSTLTARSGFITYTTDGLFGATAATSKIILPNTGSDIRFGYATSGDGIYYGRIGILSFNTDKVSFGAAGPNIFTINTGTSNTERLRIDASGNVGIGTGSPLTQLHVNDGVNVSNLTMLTLSQLGNTGDRDIVNLKMSFNNGNVPGIMLSAIKQADAGSALSFSTGAAANGALAERMRITAAGNVGIGTTNPGAKLEVTNGDIWLNATSSAINPEIRFIDDSGIGVAGAKIRYGNGDGNLYIEHVYNEAASGIFFKNRTSGTSLNTLSLVNGNVGVGLTSPGAFLDVKGAGNTEGAISLQLRSGNSNTIFSSNQITFGYLNLDQYRHAIKTRHNSGAGGGNSIDFYTWQVGVDNSSAIGTQHVMSLDSGNVGIGTTSPTSKLHVVGAANVTGTLSAGIGTFNATGNTYATGNLKLNNYDASSTVYMTNAGGTFYLSTNGSTDHLIINSTGAATFSSSVTCVSLTETSSRKIKENIMSLDGSLTKVEKLRPVSYSRIGSSTTEIGLIAEEVEEVYPEFVEYDNQGNPVGVHYTRLTAVLIQSVKELKKEITELKNRN